MKLALPDLPYAEDALEPVISARTLACHHGKHHRGYVDKTRAAVAGTPLADASVEDILHRAHDNGDQGLFNNAAQVWNHAFYWRCLQPAAGQQPDGDFKAALVDRFGSVSACCETLAEAAAGQFGSGWAWLVLDPASGELAVTTTADADNPLLAGRIPLFTLDVWEHAYYLDYQQARGDYLAACLAQLVNWDFVAANWAAARGSDPTAWRLAS